MPPDGLWFPAYAVEVSRAELFNNQVQQQLDKMTHRLGHPSSLRILKLRVGQVVRKTQKSYFKNPAAGMPERDRKTYKAGGKYF